MPISLTCRCGAKLEIDDKFAGQSIPCPDCNRPLTATAPAPAPTTTSGLAVLSLLLALVGAFTVVGPIAAVVCGFLAYRQITQNPSSGVGGIRVAKAGMILGGVFTVVGLGAFLSRDLLGLDGLLREIDWAGKLEFPPELNYQKERFEDRQRISISRPSAAWGVLKTLPTGAKSSDNLMLVDARDDAQILCLSENFDPQDDLAGLRSKAIDSFRGSELVKLIGRLAEDPAAPLKERNINPIGGENTRIQEFLIDATLGGIERTFLFRVLPDGSRLSIIVGGARKHRFARWEETLRRTLGSYKTEAGQ